jgi:hypothetical protein
VTFTPEVDVKNGLFLVTPGLETTSVLSFSAELAPNSMGTNSVFVLFANRNGARVNASFSLVVFAMPRWVTMIPFPSSPKQGDVVVFALAVGDRGHIARVEYRINNLQDAITSVPTQPYYITYSTCKETGQYLQALVVEAKATYTDGVVRQYSALYDLTTGRESREDQDQSYAFYVSEDDDQDMEDRDIERANGFRDDFQALTESQYYYADPSIYTGSAINYANSVDMAISIGHGSHHTFYAGGTPVDLSTTAFGNMAACNDTGDLEYLVFVSCETLSMDNAGNTSFWSYWFHDNSTKLDKRPFTGLHMVLGFKSLVVFDYWLLDDDGEDFLQTLAHNFNAGMKVRDAWLDAVSEELDFDDGNNRAAVLYLEKYENDRLGSAGDDYIFGNGEYSSSRMLIEYWE